MLLRVGLFQILAVDPVQVDARIVGDAAVLERLADGDIGVAVLDVLADDGHIHLDTSAA